MNVVLQVSLIKDTNTNFGVILSVGPMMLILMDYIINPILHLQDRFNG